MRRYSLISLAQAAKQGCTVDTLTLSIEQKKYAEARIAKLGLQDKIRVHLCDYRNLPPEFEKAFDAFVSVEMVEVRSNSPHRLRVFRNAMLIRFLQHVGYRYLPQYFKIVDWALKSERGAAVVTATTQPDSRFDTFQCVLCSSRGGVWADAHFLGRAISPANTFGRMRSARRRSRSPALLTMIQRASSTSTASKTTRTVRHYLRVVDLL